MGGREGEREGGDLELEELSLFRKGGLHHVPRMPDSPAWLVSEAIRVDVSPMSLVLPPCREVGGREGEGEPRAHVRGICAFIKCGCGGFVGNGIPREIGTCHRFVTPHVGPPATADTETRTASGILSKLCFMLTEIKESG